MNDDRFGLDASHGSDHENNCPIEAVRSRNYAKLERSERRRALARRWWLIICHIATVLIGSVVLAIPNADVRVTSRVLKAVLGLFLLAGGIRGLFWVCRATDKDISDRYEQC